MKWLRKYCSVSELLLHSGIYSNDVKIHIHTFAYCSILTIVTLWCMSMPFYRHIMEYWKKCYQSRSHCWTCHHGSILILNSLCDAATWSDDESGKLLIGFHLHNVWINIWYDKCTLKTVKYMHTYKHIHVNVKTLLHVWGLFFHNPWNALSHLNFSRIKFDESDKIAMVYSYQSGRSPKVVALFLLQTLVAI